MVKFLYNYHTEIEEIPLTLLIYLFEIGIKREYIYMFGKLNLIKQF